MGGKGWTCPNCGRDVPAGSVACPTCGRHRDDPGNAAVSATAPSGRTRATESGEPGNRPAAPSPSAELARRLGHLVEWADAARPLGIELPRPPTWAEEAAGRTDHPEVWEKAVHHLELEARRQVNAAFERMRERIGPRIARLKAYSVDTRLEHDQLEEAMHAARAGELAVALSAFQQVDRVVALKERHLEQARDDLERLLALLHDLEAIGVDASERASAISSELEADLRAGRLAVLRQRIRAVRAKAVEALRAALPGYVARLGDRLVLEQEAGVPTDAEAAELAEGARRVLAGRWEEGVRLLRRIGSSRSIRVAPAPKDGAAPSGASG